MRLLASFIAAFLSGCAPTYDRPLDDGELVLGKLTVRESLLRLKAACYFVAPNGTAWFLPAGDYAPISANSNGIFYGTPYLGSLPYDPNEYIPPGKSRPIFGGGIHFPFDGPAGLPPAILSDVVNVEWGKGGRVRGPALPDQCWKPYGTRMVIVHKGVEVPLP